MFPPVSDTHPQPADPPRRRADGPGEGRGEPRGAVFGQEVSRDAPRRADHPEPAAARTGSGDAAARPQTRPAGEDGDGSEGSVPPATPAPDDRRGNPSGDPGAAAPPLPTQVLAVPVAASPVASDAAAGPGDGPARHVPALGLAGDGSGGLAPGRDGGGTGPQGGSVAQRAMPASTVVPAAGGAAMSTASPAGSPGAGASPAGGASAIPSAAPASAPAVLPADLPADVPSASPVQTAPAAQPTAPGAGSVLAMAQSARARGGEGADRQRMVSGDPAPAAGEATRTRVGGETAAPVAAAMTATQAQPGHPPVGSAAPGFATGQGLASGAAPGADGGALPEARLLTDGMIIRADGAPGPAGGAPGAGGAGLAAGPSVPAMPSLPAHVSQQIVSALSRGGDGRIDLVLSPEELGRVRLSLAPGDNGITVHISTDRPETLALIRRHVDLLAQDFRAIGYHSVDFGFSDRSGGQDRAGREGGGTDAPAAAPGPFGPSGTPSRAGIPEIHLTGGRAAGLDLRL